MYGYFTNRTEGVNILERIVKAIRLTATGADSSMEDQEGMEGLLIERGVGSNHLRATVQREMQYLQFDVPTIPDAKLREIMLFITGNSVSPGLDDVVTMYI